MQEEVQSPCSTAGGRSYAGLEGSAYIALLDNSGDNPGWCVSPR